MKPYRQNVCAVLVNAGRSQVLVFRRANDLLLERPWQFPQGGLHKGEAPEAGLLRELEEEIGTADAELLGRAPEPIRYDYPPGVTRKLKAEGSKLARFRGQEQHWFLARLRGGTERIHFDNLPREFDAFRWVDPEQALELVVPFKRAAYVQGLMELGLLKPPGPAKQRRAARPAKPAGRKPKRGKA